MTVSPVLGFIYALVAFTIGTSSNSPGSSEKGLTLTVISCFREIVSQLAPAYIVSVWESNTLVFVLITKYCKVDPIFLLEIELKVLPETNLVKAQIHRCLLELNNKSVETNLFLL